MLKVLLTADVHMDNNLPFAKPTKNGLTDRFEDQLEVLRQIDEIAEKHKVDAKFILGDLFNKPRADAVTLTHTVEALLKSKIPLYILPGNHDANNIRGGRFLVEVFGKMRRSNISVMSDRHPVRIKGVHFWPIEYKPVGETRRSIKEIRKKIDKKERNVLLLHNSVVGAQSYGWKCEDGLGPKFVCKGFEAVISGHFHATQTFGKNGMYLGAPMQHHFGDTLINPVCWIVKFKRAGAEFISVSIKAPRFFVIKGVNDTLDVEKGDYVRYDIKANHTAWVRLKPRVQKQCDDLSESGIHASFRHIPIHNKESRLKAEVTGGKVPLSRVIAQYVQVSDTGKMSKKKLRLLGKEVLREVRSR